MDIKKIPFLVLFFLCLCTSKTHAELQFLGISDIHYGQQVHRGDGHDTDIHLFKSAMQKFSSLSKSVDFIITLGDLPSHRLFFPQKRLKDIQTVFNSLYHADLTKKPMFYIPGNNDAIEGNYGAFSWQGKSPLDASLYWHNACIYCKGLMIDKIHAHDKGYYSSYVLLHNRDIILIALNSIPFAKHPFFAASYAKQNQDALEELRWLDQQLKQHHAQQLLIAMHIPPGQNYQGKSFWDAHYLQLFLASLNRYAGQYEEINLLTGHTHMDEIRLISLANKRKIYAYSIPSISRIHHNNPALKIFSFTQKLRLKNYTTYYTEKDQPWQSTYYRAIKENSRSIFPQCHQKILADCLKELNAAQVCQHLQKGLFYGVKSPRVDDSVCTKTYTVL